MVGLFVVIALLLKIFVVQTFYIPSGSMENTLLENDKIVVNKLAYKFDDEPKRGDIIVFHSPPAFLEEQPDIKILVKRVIGVPGDTIYTKKGILYVNDVKADEPYLKDKSPTANLEKQTIEPGQLFMMGDNRVGSWDSRYWGTADEDLVIGKAFVRVWPVTRISGLN